MVSVHDLFPTLASIIGLERPHGPADRRRRSERVLHWQAGQVEPGQPDPLHRGGVAAVRWRQYRIYPKPFVSSAGNPAMYGLAGHRREGNGFPAIFNIEADPREEVNVVGTSAWVIGPYLKLIGEDQKSLEKCPNPEAVNMTEFGR